MNFFHCLKINLNMSLSIEKRILDHKFILLVVDHYNPLGIVRSLGEEGIIPIVILVCENDDHEYDTDNHVNSV